MARRDLWRTVGIDTTAGRYADVEIYRCPDCGALWLRYFVEYEAFERSSRWARGLIAPDLAAAITPEQAPAHLGALPWVIFGGSWFGHGGRRGSGALSW